MQHQVFQNARPENTAMAFHSVEVQPPASASQQSCDDFSTISYARVLVLQPGGSRDTGVDMAEIEPHVEAPTQHVAGRLAVPGIFADIECKVLMDSDSSITAMSEELVLALQRQLGVTQTALMQAFVGYARVVTLLSQEAMRLCSGKKTLSEKLGIGIINGSVKKAHGRQDDPGMEYTALAVGEPHVGAVLWSAMSAMALGLVCDAPGYVDDKVTLPLLSQRPMVFQHSEAEMQDRVGAL